MSEKTFHIYSTAEVLKKNKNKKNPFTTVVSVNKYLPSYKRRTLQKIFYQRRPLRGSSIGEDFSRDIYRKRLFRRKKTFSKAFCNGRSFRRKL